MSEPPVSALLVESQLEYVHSLRQGIANVDFAQIKIIHATSLQDALEFLSEANFDIILLDLSLPDSQGFATLSAIYGRAAHIPIIVLSAQDDQDMALHVIREGAQDFLPLEGANPLKVIRLIQIAMLRHRAIEHLRQLALVDELTGLLNRRGFFSLGKQHIQIAQRSNRHLLLFYSDLDHLKSINDRFGHHEGDRALEEIALVLKDTFRSSDLIARIGGDEFTVLAVDAPSESVESILARLGNQLQLINLRNPYYKLSLSTGYARFDPQAHPDLENMLIEADRALYRFKEDKTNGA
jgi:two-component system cell cycle response regulator